jgi:hypothetical protein
MPFGRRSAYSFGGYDDYSGSFSRYGGGYGVYDFAAELRREEERAQRELLRELQRMAVGSRRRKVELERFGKFVPAGEWDADCEAWPEKSYKWSVGAFEMEICRGPTHAWNGYVTLPAGYPHREKSYDFWNGRTDDIWASGLPRPPVRELTYGNSGKFGFDHSWGGDRQPMVTKPGAGNHDGCIYTTAEMAINEVWRLAAYFASLVLGGTLPTTAEWMAEHKESLLKIVEQDMRIAARINAEKRAAAAAAAEAARIAAEKAAAEAAEAARIAAERAAAEAAEKARLAAEAAERQRLWDEAHPEEAEIRKAEERTRLLDAIATSTRSEASEATARKQAAAELYTREKERLVRVREILQEIEALRAREEAGEVLTKAEDRQLNREDQLRRELKNRERGAALHEDKKLADATAEADAADEKSVAAQAAADAAHAEVQRLKDAWAAKQTAAQWATRHGYRVLWHTR